MSGGLPYQEPNRRNPLLQGVLIVNIHLFTSFSASRMDGSCLRFLPSTVQMHNKLPLYHSVPSHILFGIIHMEVAIDDPSIFGGLFSEPKMDQDRFTFPPIYIMEVKKWIPPIGSLPFQFTKNFPLNHDYAGKEYQWLFFLVRNSNSHWSLV